ncbi:MAG: acyl carrier protein [Oscillospiraceae bacterium]|jgi:acyl carrier protein|nr:acyl carrier protein [Oscillospiraceae bacterium]
MESTMDRLQALVREYLGDPGVTITGQTLLTADLGLDSYDVASLITEAEIRFGIEIPDRVLAQMLTAGDLGAYIARNTAQ